MTYARLAARSLFPFEVSTKRRNLAADLLQMALAPTYNNLKLPADGSPRKPSRACGSDEARDPQRTRRGLAARQVIEQGRCEILVLSLGAPPVPCPCYHYWTRWLC